MLLTASIALQKILVGTKIGPRTLELRCEYETFVNNSLLGKFRLSHLTSNEKDVVVGSTIIPEKKDETFERALTEYRVRNWDPTEFCDLPAYSTADKETSP